MTGEEDKSLNAMPFPDPALTQSVKSVFELWQHCNARKDEACLPGIVAREPVREEGMVVVQPLVNVVTSEDESIARPLISLPVHHFQHGSFFIDAPLHKGDTGWIVAADRDTSNALLRNCLIQGPESGIGRHDAKGIPLGNEGPQDPGVFDSHKFVYGFFLPDKWGGVPLPADMAKSLVIQEVNPDGSSRGRIVLDPDGTIRLLSSRWYDGSSSSLKGGSVFIDLSWKGKTPSEPSESWREGDLTALANAALQGDLAVSEWKAPDGTTRGGRLTVARDAEVKGGFTAWLAAKFRSAVEVLGESVFRQRLTVVRDHKKAVIDPDDLHKTAARFREILVVTGIDKNRTRNGTVALAVKRMRALTDDPEKAEPITFEASGGGSEPTVVYADDKSVRFVTIDGENRLEIVGWNTALADKYREEISVIDAVLNNTGTESGENADKVRLVPIYTQDANGAPQVVYYQAEGFGTSPQNFAIADYLEGDATPDPDHPEKLMVRRWDSDLGRYVLAYMTLGRLVMSAVETDDLSIEFRDDGESGDSGNDQGPLQLLDFNLPGSKMEGDFATMQATGSTAPSGAQDLHLLVRDTSPAAGGATGSPVLRYLPMGWLGPTVKDITGPTVAGSGKVYKIEKTDGTETDLPIPAAGGGSVEVDDVSIEFRAQDEGGSGDSGDMVLQVKGFAGQTAESDDVFSIATATGSSHPSATGLQVIVRDMLGETAPKLKYLPLGAFNTYLKDITGSNDESTDDLTVTVEKGDGTIFQFTIPSSGGGGGGGPTGPTGPTGPSGQPGPTGATGAAAGFGTITASATGLNPGSAPSATVEASGSDTSKNLTFTFGIPTVTMGNLNPQDCVLSTSSPTPGTSHYPARQDHVHKLPDTVMDTVNAQSVSGAKTFYDEISTGKAGVGLTLVDGASNAIRLYGIGGSGGGVRLYVGDSDHRIFNGTTGSMTFGAGFDSVTLGDIANKVMLATAPTWSGAGDNLKVATLGYVRSLIPSGATGGTFYVLPSANALTWNVTGHTIELNGLQATFTDGFLTAVAATTTVIGSISAIAHSEVVGATGS